MSGASKREEGRVSVYISPEAKVMLQEMAHQWFPNLHRPLGSAIDRIIREEYQRQKQKEQTDGKLSR